MNCTKQSTDRDLEGRRWLHVEVGRQESYLRYDIKTQYYLQMVFIEIYQIVFKMSKIAGSVLWESV